MVKLKKRGGRIQEVKAVDCGSTIRGFESHRPPSKKPLTLEVSGFLALRWDKRAARSPKQTAEPLLLTLSQIPGFPIE